MLSYCVAKLIGGTLVTLGTAHYIYLLGPSKKQIIAIIGIGCATTCYWYCARKQNKMEGKRIQNILEQSNDAVKESELVTEVIFLPDSITIDSKMSSAPRELRGMMYKNILYENATKEGAGLQKLRNRLLKAVKSIDICLFNITSDQLTHSVCECIDRGVKVRLIIDGSAAESNIQVQKFRSSGAFVRSSWKPEPATVPSQHSGDNAAATNGDYLMHHKFAIIDNYLLITGSFNWTMQALMGNNENIIITTENKLVIPFEEEFENLWEKFDPKPF